MVKYTSAILAAAVSTVYAAPAHPVCQAVITISYGSPIWVPNPAPSTTAPAASWTAWPVDPKSTTKTPDVNTKTVTWSVWDPTTSKPTVPTSSASTWGEWDPTTSKPSVPTSSASTWSEWDPTTSKPSVPTSSASTWGQWDPTTSKTPVASSSATSQWSDWSSSATATTTKPAVTTTTTKPYEHTTTTTTTTTTAATTTTEAPKAAATCPAGDKTTFKASGSCKGSYTINCGVKTDVPKDGSAKFWEHKSGEIVATLDACVALCDDNKACTAVLYVDQDGASAQDYKRCWQTSGLPQPNAAGYAAMVYKGDVSGQCSSDYTS